jgi:hypothetical protein
MHRTGMSYTALYVRARDGGVLGFVLEIPSRRVLTR